MGTEWHGRSICWGNAHQGNGARSGRNGGPRLEIRGNYKKQRRKGKELFNALHTKELV